MSEPLKHDWKLAWPGNWCLRCGIEDPMETAEWIDCPKCAGYGVILTVDCPECGGQGAYPDPNTPCPPCYFPSPRDTTTP